MEGVEGVEVGESGGRVERRGVYKVKVGEVQYTKGVRFDKCENKERL